jgi:hypothetical protein
VVRNYTPWVESPITPATVPSSCRLHGHKGEAGKRGVI